MNEWVWSSGGMILTGENWSSGRKTLYSVGGRWMNGYGAMVEWYWQGKTEVLGEKHYTAWVVDEWMSMEQWWNDTDRGKLKCWVDTTPFSLCPPQISRRLAWNPRLIFGNPCYLIWFVSTKHSTTSLTFNNSTFRSHSVFVCFVWIWEQTTIISLYNINWLVCITETESVYCAVEIKYSNITEFDFRSVNDKIL